METGTVKWFNDQKGYGFVRQDGVDEDIFVHHTAIKMEGFRTLTPGEVVEFEINRDEKGMKAINVNRTGQVVEDPESVNVTGTGQVVEDPESVSPAQAQT